MSRDQTPSSWASRNHHVSPSSNPMQMLRSTASHHLWVARPVLHSISNVGLTRSLATSSHASESTSTPWFVDPEETAFAARRTQKTPALSRPQTQPRTIQPIPDDVPTPIQHLYFQLAQSPLLEPSYLTVQEPLAMPPGPPLPEVAPKGRRRRGRTYGGEGVEDSTGLWDWVIMAQVSLVGSLTAAYLLTQ